MSEDATAKTLQKENSPRKHGALGFIAFFILIVMSLLIGYSFSHDSKVNDWYLFQVAKHTGWVLEHIGQSADVTRVPKGPRVRFILTPSLNSQIQDLEAKLHDFEKISNSQISTPSPEALHAELDALRQRQQDALKDLDKQQSAQGKIFSFIVVSECGAIEVMVIFLAAVLAFPTPPWKRIVGAIAGIPILYSVNILRLTCLGYIGAIDTTRKWFSFTHEYLWQAVYVVFVVAVWLLWVEYLVKRKT